VPAFDALLPESIFSFSGVPYYSLNHSLPGLCETEFDMGKILYSGERKRDGHRERGRER